MGRTREFVLQAQSDISDPARAERVAGMVDDLATYDAGFRKVVAQYGELDTLVARNYAEGADMRKKLADIMDSAYRDDDTVAAYHAGVAQQQVLLTRLFMTRYQNNSLNDDYYRAFEEVTLKFGEALAELDAELQNPQRRALRDEIAQHADNYAARMSEIYTVIMQRDEVIAELASLGGKISGDAEWIKLDILAQQDTLGPLIQSIIVIVSLTALVFAGVITLIITRSIKTPLEGIVQQAEAMGRGDFSAQSGVQQSDEMGLLADTFSAIQGKLSTLLTETETLIGAVGNGKLDVRADASGFVGGWGSMVTGLNSLVDAFVAPINVTAEYIDRVAKGSLPTRISDEYRGDFNEIKSNLNQLIDSLSGFIDDMRDMAAKHDAGDIDVSIDHSRYAGFYRAMSEGVNDMVFDHMHMNREAMAVFDEFGRGNFEADMAPLPGKKRFINESINRVRGNLAEFNKELGGVIEALKRGQLDRRANAEAFAGGWRSMIGGINDVILAIAAPLDESGKAIGLMATGDLTARMTNSYGGDLKRFGDNVNSLGESLSGLIAEVNRSVTSTADSAQAISNTAGGMAVSWKDQANQSEQVSTAVEDMARTITENAMNATKTAELAENSGRVANSGGEVLEQTIGKMRDISAVVRESADNIGRLGESSKQIGDIVSVIDEIAYQTNLLALNAATEAARAGEQGRGFAVVAEEVRRLAERTSEATKQIGEMIKRIQVETRDAVASMDKGTSEVGEGIRLADKAGASLTEILESIQSVLERINQIAVASEQQSATSEEISASVTSIFQVARESADEVDEVARTSRGMTRQTEELSQLMSRFRIAKADDR